MEWSKVATTGEKPGPRDSHSAVLVGHKMIVFGGTNGFKKVNDIHILDLFTKEWVSPKCEGTPPSPRESHTATLVGGERLVVFGGSGEGDANYLNDLHILDFRTMRWSNPEVKGDLPVPRDSHCTLSVGNKLIVYGGDSGDQYHGDVNLLDMETMIWTRVWFSLSNLIILLTTNPYFLLDNDFDFLFFFFTVEKSRFVTRSQSRSCSSEYWNQGMFSCLFVALISNISNDKNKNLIIIIIYNDVIPKIFLNE